MSEATDNLVLRLLQDIRLDLGDQSRLFEGLNGSMTGMERHIEDMKESVGLALGLSTHAKVAYETTGQRLDRLTDKITGLEARITTLETSK